MNKQFSGIVFSVLLLTVTGMNAAADTATVETVHSTTVANSTTSKAVPAITVTADEKTSVVVPATSVVTVTPAVAPVKAETVTLEVPMNTGDMSLKQELEEAQATIAVVAKTQELEKVSTTPTVETKTVVQEEVPAKLVPAGRRDALKAPEVHLDEKNVTTTQTTNTTATETKTDVSDAGTTTATVTKTVREEVTKNTNSFERQDSDDWSTPTEPKKASWKDSFKNSLSSFNNTVHTYTWSGKKKYVTGTVLTLATVYALYKLYSHYYPVEEEDEDFNDFEININ